MDTHAPCLVMVQFGRVQTYLFQVSELKSMIGANTLLGEVLRGRLDAEADDFVQSGDDLPGLARGLGSALPSTVKIEDLQLSGALSGDPLKGDDHDNPLLSYKRGILARDGGHFHAVFPNREMAERFIEQARDLVARRLPGLIVKARVTELQQGANGWEKRDETPAKEGRTGEDHFDLPVLQVCRVTGQGPASGRDDRDPDEEEQKQPLSLAVLEKRKRARVFDRGTSHDILGLLRKEILQRLGLQGLAEKQALKVFPNQFNDVAADSGYLAVLAADGNGMGSRSMKWREGGPEDFFQREARGEQFFHAMRSTVRIALVAALAEVFEKVEFFKRRLEQVRQGRGKLPFRLMMLGGDDLLLVCDALFVMHFARAYAEQLARRPLQDLDGKPIDVGIGVAIVKKTFPFHRAHALAEQLAASAKRYWRSLRKPKSDEQPGSTIDWLAISEAWHDDVAEVRRRDALVRYTVPGGSEETLILSRKPYRVLGQGGDSLQGLLDTATQAACKSLGRAGRSQLMALAEALPHGRRQADRALRQAPTEVRSALADIIQKHSELSVWREVQGPTYSSSVLDFLELYELERILRAQQERQKEGQPA